MVMGSAFGGVLWSSLQGALLCVSIPILMWGLRQGQPGVLINTCAR